MLSSVVFSLACTGRITTVKSRCAMERSRGRRQMLQTLIIIITVVVMVMVDVVMMVAVVVVIVPLVG